MALEPTDDNVRFFIATGTPPTFSWCWRFLFNDWKRIGGFGYRHPESKRELGLLPNLVQTRAEGQQHNAQG